MCTELSVDCSNDMDLYDEAILGLGTTTDPEVMDDSPTLVYESTEIKEQELINLYDDVSPRAGREQRDTSLQSRDDYYANLPDRYIGSHSSSSTSKCQEDYCLYVGNLTWWTSETDISEAVRSLGVEDFIDVKFFENASNGQSKGFCRLTLGSEKSTRTVKERLPEIDLHGRKPIVAYPTRNILYQFEAQNPMRSRSKRSYR